VAASDLCSETYGFISFVVLISTDAQDKVESVVIQGTESHVSPGLLGMMLSGRGYSKPAITLAFTTSLTTHNSFPHTTILSHTRAHSAMCWNQLVYACGHCDQSFSLTCKCPTRTHDLSATIRCQPGCAGPTPNERKMMPTAVSS